MGDSGTKQRIVKRFDSEGIDSTRLRLLGRTPDLLSHLRLYNDVHIALDTFPYNGTTTTCEALWMGTPVVTLSGEVHASRVGEALLRVVGREGWVARDADDYVARVLGLAADRAALSAASAGLRAALDAAPAFQPGRMAGDIETLARDAWADWCASSSRRAGKS